MRCNSNLDRAGRALITLDTFRRHDSGEEDDRTLILDLIADLGHLATRRKLHFVRIAAQAVSAWAYERKNPDGLGASPQVTIAIDARRPKQAWSRARPAQ